MVFSKEQGIQPHVTGLLADAINSPGDADNRCESLDENSGLLNTGQCYFYYTGLPPEVVSL